MTVIKTFDSVGAVIGVLLTASGTAQAFECPQHFEAAQAAMDKAGVDTKAMADTMSREEIALIHALLDDAKAWLAGA